VVSPKQWTTWVYLHFPKSVIPCFVRKRDVTQSFASLANFIPRLVGIRNVKCYSPVYRNTEHQVSFPGWPDYGSLLKFSFLKCRSPFVGWWNVKSVIPSVSGPEMSPIKMSLSTNHQFTNTFQNFPMSTQDLVFFSFIYQHGSGQSFSPVNLQYPLAESGPFLQQIWVAFFIQNKSFIITSRAFITS